MSIYGAGSSSSSIAGATVYDGVPVNLIANTNDLSIDPDEFSMIALRSIAAVNLTGLAHAQTSRVVIVSNVGAFNITLVNESGSSEADHQFNLGGANIILAPGDSVGLICLLRTAGWQLLFSSIATGSGGGGGVTFGTYLEYAAAAGETDNTDPAGFGPGVGRLDVDTTAGAATFTGLIAGADGQGLIISNIGANLLTLDALSGSSLAANQFRAPGNIALIENQSQLFVYYAGSVNKWVAS
ncbi:MAG: hypothetical protein ACRD33_00130 [Candidatus Acidiferrales bacterium]